MYARLNNIEYHRRIQSLCRTPFRNNKKGCINYNKKKGCPPRQLLDEMFDLASDLYIIYTAYNIGEFAERMKNRHPEWSLRQTHNPRLWQPAARKKHKEDIIDFKKKFPHLTVDACPEALGLNVTSAMKSIGIDLDWSWPPMCDMTYRVSVAGLKKNTEDIYT